MAIAFPKNRINMARIAGMLYIRHKGKHICTPTELVIVVNTESQWTEPGGSDNERRTNDTTDRKSPGGCCNIYEPGDNARHSRNHIKLCCRKRKNKNVERNVFISLLIDCGEVEFEFLPILCARPHMWYRIGCWFFLSSVGLWQNVENKIELIYSTDTHATIINMKKEAGSGLDMAWAGGELRCFTLGSDQTGIYCNGRSGIIRLWEKNSHKFESTR